MTVHPIKATTSRKRVSVLGATGSIGGNTLEVMAQHPEQFELVAITAQQNVEKLAEIALQTRPAYCVIGNESLYQTLKDKLAGTGIEIAAGEAALSDAVAHPTDIVVAAIVGSAGLMPVMNAIKHGRTVALANKESLVCAGSLIRTACEKYGATLLPIDSEHSAIFQVFDFERPQRIEHITLTASGGPFLHDTPEQLAQVTPADAIRHPNWSMGAKISVDSATMMNKALEMIEAYHLFPLRPEQIHVLIHPESVVHSLVHYVDGSVLAQLGTPDMRTPIAHALAWPDRVAVQAPRLDLAAIGALHFLPPDEIRFPALRLARQVLQSSPHLAIAFNAANEMAVQSFLASELPFNAILSTIEQVLAHTQSGAIHSLEDVLTCDAAARQHAQQIIKATA